MSEIGLEEAKKWLSLMAASVRAAQYDLKHIATHGRIIYNVDFNLLAPLLADAAPVGLPHFFMDNRDHYAGLLERVGENESIVLAISEPTVLEVIDLLLHRKNRVSDLQQRATKFEFELQTELPITESDAIRKELEDLVATASLPRNSKKIADNLLSLIDNRQVIGLGDVIDKKAITQPKKMYKLFQDTYQEQVKVRSSRDIRTAEDKEFHYKIDALNICITLATASSLPSKQTFFVSGTGLNTNLCELQNLSYGRKPLVPIYVQNAIAIDGRVSNDGILRETEDVVCGLLRTLSRSASLNDRLLKQIAGLKGTYLDELSGENYLKEKAAVSEHARDHFASAQELYEAVRNESSALEEGAKSIAAEIAGKVDYLERFLIFDDPIVKKLERELNIKLRE